MIGCLGGANTASCGTNACWRRSGALLPAAVKPVINNTPKPIRRPNRSFLIRCGCGMPTLSDEVCAFIRARCRLHNARLSELPSSSANLSERDSSGRCVKSLMFCSRRMAVCPVGMRKLLMAYHRVVASATTPTTSNAVWIQAGIHDGRSNRAMPTAKPKMPRLGQRASHNPSQRTDSHERIN